MVKIGPRRALLRGFFEVEGNRIDAPALICGHVIALS
jgi:hypothetical protein